MCVGSYLYKCVLTLLNSSPYREKVWWWKGNMWIFRWKNGTPLSIRARADLPLCLPCLHIWIFKYLNGCPLVDRRICICIHMDTQVFKYSHMQILKYTNVCMFGDMGLLVFTYLNIWMFTYVNVCMSIYFFHVDYIQIFAYLNNRSFAYVK